MAKPTYRQRAAAGAKLLDKKYGRGWARKIKLRRLDQQVGGYYTADDGCGCVAAQLDAARGGGYGSYGSEMDRLFTSFRHNELHLVGEHDREVARHGFNLYSTEQTLVYSPLTEAWKNEVRSRR